MSKKVETAIVRQASRELRRPICPEGTKFVRLHSRFIRGQLVAAACYLSRRVHELYPVVPGEFELEKPVFFLGARPDVMDDERTSVG